VVTKRFLSSSSEGYLRDQGFVDGIAFGVLAMLEDLIVGLKQTVEMQRIGG